MAVIELQTLIGASRERVFDLARSIEVHQDSTAGTDERAVAGVTSGLIGLGEEVTWEARHLGVRQRLRVKLTAFERPHWFQDAMLQGAFARMQHDHRFEERNGQTLMSDRFEFASPFGPLGRLVDWLFLTRYMRSFLLQRNARLKQIAESEAWRAYLEAPGRSSEETVPPGKESTSGNLCPAGRLHARRLVIVGNAGAGKSHLARALADGLAVPVVALDAIFWRPGGFNVRRPPAERDRLIAESRSEAVWIAEGEFGDLAERFLEWADALIWLDLPWETCRAGLLARGSESSRQNDPIQAESSFRELLAWAAEYESRTDLRSRSGHERLFREFPRRKVRLCSREEVNTFLTKERGKLPPDSEPPAGGPASHRAGFER
jgi:ligand-binding SRPBCC domain-containing protein/adenylate kinase family enzyme